MAAHSSGNASVRSGHILPLMALNVCTGTAMALMAQYVNDLVRQVHSNANACQNTHLIQIVSENHVFCA